MSRGLEVLEEAIQAVGIFVPSDDYRFEKFDKIECRVIKFGDRNKVNYKEKGTPGEKNYKPGNTTENIRMYLHVYSWFEAATQSFFEDRKNKTLKINPQVAWLTDFVKNQKSLAEDTKRKDEIFRHKLELFRIDQKSDKSEGFYGFIKVTDQGVDSNFVEDDHENIIEEKKEDKKPNDSKTQENPKQDTNKSETTKTDSSNKAENNNSNAATNAIDYEALFAKQSSVEDAITAAKEALVGVTDKDKQKEISIIYRKHKDRIIAKQVSDSKDPMALAEELCKKYYPKEPEKQKELKEYAETVKEGMSDSDLGSEDDLPF